MFFLPRLPVGRTASSARGAARKRCDPAAHPARGVAAAAPRRGGLWTRWLFAGLSLSSCTLSNPGQEPDLTAIYFPVSLVASGDDLLVVNSNFDLSYNGAVVQRFSRRAIDEVLAADQDGIVSPADGLLGEGQSVVIDSHSARASLSLDGTLLYVPVRSRASLTVLRLTGDGKLSCDQDANARCDERFRLGETASANLRAVTLPSDPSSVAVGDMGDLGGTPGDEFLVVGHGGGRASLFLRDATADPTTLPRLVDVLENLPLNINVARLEQETQLVWMTNPASAVRDATDGQVTRVGAAYLPDSPENSFLFQLDSRRVEGVSLGQDTRDIVFGNLRGREVAYVLARSPEAVWIVNRNAADGALVADRIIPVGEGPTELVEGTLDVLGVPRTVLFVTCYGAREIYVIDPLQGGAVSLIRGSASRADQDRDSSRMSGPFAVAFSPADGVLPARLYVADFRASTIRVIDFAPLIACLAHETPRPAESSSCEPVVLGTLGVPRPAVGELR